MAKPAPWIFTKPKQGMALSRLLPYHRRFLSTVGAAAKPVPTSSSSSSSSSSSGSISLDHLLLNAHQLLASYRTGRLDDARSARQYAVGLVRYADNPAAINTAVDLLLKSQSTDQTLTNEVLRNWKILAKTEPRTSIAWQSIAARLPPGANRDYVTTTHLLEVILRRDGLDVAVNFLRGKKLNIFVANMLLKAWADSDRPDAREQMEQLLATMAPPVTTGGGGAEEEDDNNDNNDESSDNKTTVLRRNKFTTSILLSYYTKHNLYDAANALLSHTPQADLDSTTGSQAVAVLAEQDRIDEAIHIVQTKLRGTKNLGMGCQHVLRALRRQLTEEPRRRAKLDVIDQTRSFYASVETEMRQRDNRKSNDKLLGTVLDIFATARRKEETEEYYQKVHRPNLVHCGIMIKHYKWQDQADRASAMLKEYLDRKEEPVGDEDGRISITLFNGVLDAWASSSLPNPIAHAIETYELLLYHPKCQMAALKPSLATFGCLVRFFAQAGRSGEPLLSVMEQHQLQPDSAILASVVVSCVKGGDLAACERTLARMNDLSIHAYQNLAKMVFPEDGRTLSREHVKSIEKFYWQQIKNLTKPHVLNLLLAMWSIGPSPARYISTVSIYRQATVPGDHNTFAIVIFILSSSRRPDDIAFAEELALRSLHTQSAYVQVRDGWLRLQQPARAARLLKLQHTVGGVSPNAFDIYTVVKVYLEEKMIDEAFALVADMKKLLPNLPLPKNALEMLAVADAERTRRLAALFGADNTASG